MSDEDVMSTGSGGSGDSTIIEYRHYTPSKREFAGDENLPIGESYGLVQAHFKEYQHFYGRYQRLLGQARIGTIFDLYLTKVLRYTALSVLVGLLIGVISLATITGILAVHIPVVPTGISITVLCGFLVGSLVGGGLLLRPWYIARKRRIDIDTMLPHVVVFLEAASKINPNPVKLIRDVSNYKTIYGELALEFETIRKDVDVLNDDLLRALDNAEAHIPSTELQEFFDDLSSLLESGGNIEDFLATEVKQQLNKTEEDLDELLRTLTTLAPIFVIVVAVGPVVLLVTLLVLGMIGANVVHLLLLLTYLGLPLIILTSIVLLDGLTSRHRLAPKHELDTMNDETKGETPDANQPWFESYLKRKRFQTHKDRLFDPVQTMRRHPRYSLLLTGPIAVISLLIISFTGTLPPSWEGFTDEAIPYTTGYLLVPFLIVSLPVMVLHELKQRRANAFESRFPDALNALASANERGVPLDEGIELISRRFEGPIAEEFQKTHRDIQLEHDIAHALGNLANRHHLPRITLTVAVLQKIVRSSEQLTGSLRSLADDMEMRLSLERERLQEMQSYAVVVSLGVIIYLLIILVLDTYLLPQVPDLGAQSLMGLGEQPAITIYQMVFFHSSLILATGSGLLMGLLTRDSLLSGLKYVNGLIILVLLAFLGAGFF